MVPPLRIHTLPVVVESEGSEEVAVLVIDNQSVLPWIQASAHWRKSVVIEVGNQEEDRSEREEVGSELVEGQEESVSAATAVVEVAEIPS